MTDETQLDIQADEEPQLPSKVQLEQTVERATDMAKTLANIISQNKLSVKIGKGEHIRVEAWQTVGRFCGYTVRTREIPHDGPGRKATAEVIRLSDGMVVSTATHECGTKGDDVWVNRPPNAQASMAQTRAAGKAFRNILSWIVVLAGYDTTPAEEMPRTSDVAQPAKGRSAPEVVDKGHGICAEHGVAYFQSPRMRGPAHQTGDGGWCNKEADALAPQPRQAPAPTNEAAEMAETTTGDVEEMYGTDPLGEGAERHISADPEG